MTENIHVAVGVIRQKDRVLIAKRSEHVHQGGLWEFPGGKVEAGESVEQALKRELFEELNIKSADFCRLIQIPFQYPQKSVFLDVYWVNSFTGDAKGNEGQLIEWVELDQLSEFAFPAANRAIIQALLLGQNYLITPTQISSEFLINLENRLKAGLSLIQLRIHENVSLGFIQKLMNIQKQYQCVIQINSYTWQNVLNSQQQKMICQAGLSSGKLGIHLTSSELYKEFENPLSGRLSASCHSKDDILTSNQKKLDFIVLSPVLKTQSHPGTENLGWEAFEKLCQLSQVPVYALGGMHSQYLEKAINLGAQGIAGIRNFWENAD